MQLSKAILLILVLVTAAAAIGVTVCETAGLPLRTLDASMAAGVGLVAAIVGLLPLHFRTDRTPVALFQSAWIGSILHMALAATLGIATICLRKLTTSFVIWLLLMYWITLIGLCLAFVNTLRLNGMGPTRPSNAHMANELAAPEVPTT